MMLYNVNSERSPRIKMYIMLVWYILLARYLCACLHWHLSIKDDSIHQLEP